MKTAEQLEQHLRDLAKSCMDFSFMGRTTDNQELRDMRREADAFRVRCLKALDKLAKQHAHDALCSKLRDAFANTDGAKGLRMADVLDAAGVHGSREDQSRCTEAMLATGWRREYIGAGASAVLGFKRG